VEFIQSVITWLTDAAHWSGSDGVPNRLFEHLVLSAVTTAVAVALALPFGVWAGHTKRGGFIAVNVANLGRAMPSLALLALMFPLALSLHLGFGFWPT